MSEHGHTIEVDGVHIGTHSVRAMLARIAELEAENAAYSIVNTRQAEQIVDLEAAQEWLQHFSDDVTAKMEYQARRAEQAEANYNDVVAEYENEKALRLEAKAELAALKDVAEAMEEFIDGCAYHVRCGKTVHYGGPRIDVAARAEEGGGDE